MHFRSVAANVYLYSPANRIFHRLSNIKFSNSNCCCCFTVVSFLNSAYSAQRTDASNTKTYLNTYAIKASEFKSITHRQPSFVSFDYRILGIASARQTHSNRQVKGPRSRLFLIVEVMHFVFGFCIGLILFFTALLYSEYFY